MATITEPPTKYPAVQYTDLRDYLKLLEEKNFVHRIACEVDPVHEMGAVAARSLERKGPALMFENIKGYPGMPLVTNIISTTQQLAVAFNTEADEEVDPPARRRRHDVPHSVGNACRPGRAKRSSSRATTSTSTSFPTPVWHELDGGRYLGTTAGIVTRDPLTGDLNMGSYRVMIMDKKTLSAGRRACVARNSTDRSGRRRPHPRERGRGPRTPVAIVHGNGSAADAGVGEPGRARARRLDGVRGRGRLARRADGTREVRDQRSARPGASRDDRRRDRAARRAVCRGTARRIDRLLRREHGQRSSSTSRASRTGAIRSRTA